MSHDRRDHWGEYPATLVELSSAIDVDLTAGMTVQEVLAALHSRISDRENSTRVNNTFTGDATISIPPWTLQDTTAGVWTLYSSDLVGGDNDVSVDPDTFSNPEVEDPNDPDEIGVWTDDGTMYITAWVKLVVDDGPRRMRIHMGNSGASDTVMFMWAQTAAPTGSDLPDHLSDDAIDGTYLPAFTNAPCVDSGGSDYNTGGAYNDDDWEFGIELANGTYWIACLNYSYTDWRDFGKGAYVITFKPVNLFTGDAYIVAA